MIAGYVKYDLVKKAFPVLGGFPTCTTFHTLKLSTCYITISVFREET